MSVARAVWDISGPVAEDHTWIVHILWARPFIGSVVISVASQRGVQALCIEVVGGIFPYDACALLRFPLFQVAVSISLCFCLSVSDPLCAYLQLLCLRLRVLSPSRALSMSVD